jgi:hypothetical protein
LTRRPTSWQHKSVCRRGGSSGRRGSLRRVVARVTAATKRTTPRAARTVPRRVGSRPAATQRSRRKAFDTLFGRLALRGPRPRMRCGGYPACSPARPGCRPRLPASGTSPARGVRCRPEFFIIAKSTGTPSSPTTRSTPAVLYNAPSSVVRVWLRLPFRWNWAQDRKERRVKDGFLRSADYRASSAPPSLAHRSRELPLY